MDWQEALDVKRGIEYILKNSEFTHIKSDRIYCFRTSGSKSRAIARIWAFPKIFQQVLSIEPAYVIEVISKRYDKLSDKDKTKVLIHELLHIPRNFSGSLLPHKYGNKTIEKEVERLYRNLK